MGECASPLGEVVDVETPRRPLANTSCPLLSAAGSVLAPTGSRTAQAAGVAMTPHPTTILGLALCLGQMIHMQNAHKGRYPVCVSRACGPNGTWRASMTGEIGRLLPPPSLRAEPGPEVPRGRPVTILCQGPAGAHTFRLEQKENRSAYMDQKITSQHGSPGTEARFFIHAVSDVTAGPYRCVYKKGSRWSELSESLELVLTGSLPSWGSPALWVPCPSAHVSLGLHTRLRALESWTHLDTMMAWTLSPASGVTTGGSSTPLTHTAPPSSAGLPIEYVYVLAGVSVAFLLCLLLLVFLLVHRQHQRKHGPLSNKSEEQRPQERLSPAVDIVERTPDIATVDHLPEKDRETHTPTQPQQPCMRRQGTQVLLPQSLPPQMLKT
ncbi:leukocyte-associated immunoglobulin-like receptor 1 isoform X2 [Rhinolophus sinicus]|uniref:leukocyte-associated immunoglobulin-like receptor 1 isoform X2 n=1 Tax=Rhinolophus sinicus TaxID=89399 RepID=UPI003D7BB4E1